MKPMTSQNYVSILKRQDLETNLMRRKTMAFNPKMIGGKIGTLLEVQQREQSTPLLHKITTGNKSVKHRQSQVVVDDGRHSTRKMSKFQTGDRVFNLPL